MLDRLRQRVKEGSYKQVEVVVGAPDDPYLEPGSMDGVLIVNSHHEMPEHQKMLDCIRRALKPDAPLVIIEPFATNARGKPRRDQEAAHVIAPELVEQDLKAANFEILARNDEFVVLPGTDRVDWLILARRR
jgi:hypothetical protein